MKIENDEVLMDPVLASANGHLEFFLVLSNERRDGDSTVNLSDRFRILVAKTLLYSMARSLSTGYRPCIRECLKPAQAQRPQSTLEALQVNEAARLK